MDRFKAIGVIKNKAAYDEQKLDYFVKAIRDLRTKNKWSRQELIDVFNQTLPYFNHKETGKFLDGKM
jgi:hypothetical protein